jgi:hypothetical protein
MTRLFALGALLGLCFFPACAESQTSGNEAAVQTAPQEVTIYLHTGTDKTGTLVSFDGHTLGLKTSAGIEKIDRKQYQGMVLNTPEEKQFSERVSRDPVLYMTGAMFVFETRNRIKAKLVEPKTTCTPQNFPMVHFIATRELKIKNRALLLSSGCKDLDHAVLQAVLELKLPEFPKDSPFDFYPINYFYEPPGFVAEPAQSAEAGQKAPGPESVAKPGASPAPKH